MSTFPRRKSSHSATSNCVQAHLQTALEVGVGDSKLSPRTPGLSFPASTWAAFVTGVSRTSTLTHAPDAVYA